MPGRIRCVKVFVTYSRLLYKCTKITGQLWNPSFLYSHRNKQTTFIWSRLEHAVSRGRGSVCGERVLFSLPVSQSPAIYRWWCQHYLSQPWASLPDNVCTQTFLSGEWAAGSCRRVPSLLPLCATHSRSAERNFFLFFNSHLFSPSSSRLISQKIKRARKAEFLFYLLWSLFRASSLNWFDS